MVDLSDAMVDPSYEREGIGEGGQNETLGRWD